MPRLSTKRYLEIHHQLKHAWLTNSGQFSELIPRDQLLLHRYFQTTSNEADDVLIRRRQELTKADPSLPHRAGRVFKLFEQIPEPQPSIVRPQPRGRRSGRERNIAVRPLMKPDIDYHKLARLLIEVARSQVTHASDSDKST